MGVRARCHQPWARRARGVSPGAGCSPRADGRNVRTGRIGLTARGGRRAALPGRAGARALAPCGLTAFPAAGDGWRLREVRRGGREWGYGGGGAGGHGGVFGREGAGE